MSAPPYTPYAAPPGAPPPPAYMRTITYYFRSRDPYAPSMPYVLNSIAVDSYGSGLAVYRVQTDRRVRETRLVRAADGATLATFEWHKRVPMVKLEGGRVECRMWAPLLEDDSTRRLTHDNKTYLLSKHRSVYTVRVNACTRTRRPPCSYSLQVTSENARNRPVAVWQTKNRYLQLEAFPDASIAPGLLDACFIALTMLECRKDLGDHFEDESGMSPRAMKRSVLDAFGGALASAFH